MKRPFPRVILILALAAVPAAAQTVNVSPPQNTAHSHDVSIDDYRQHLSALTSLVDACAKTRNAKVCDPALIGPDDRVPLVIGSRSDRRIIRYGWLRVLFSKAEDPDEKPASTKPPGETKPAEVQSTTSALLNDAKRVSNAILPNRTNRNPPFPITLRNVSPCSRCWLVRHIAT